MTKLSQILGFVFLVVGAILAITTTMMPGVMQPWGLLPDTAAIFLVGGAICLGLAGVVEALHGGHVYEADHDVMVAPGVAPAAQRPEPRKFEAPQKPAFTPELKAKDVGVASAAGAVMGAAAEAVKAKTASVADEVSPSVAETITALEQAKTDIAAALGMDKAEAVPEIVKPVAPPRPERPSIAATLERPLKVEPPPAVVVPPPPPPPPPAAEEVEEVDDPDLYVVEEKVIRGRPARVLSDGTVEAETDEGWMRFENLDHLDEYLDAMSPGS